MRSRGAYDLPFFTSLDDQRNISDFPINCRVFGKEPVCAEHIAMIRSKQDKCVRHFLPDQIQNASDFIIDKRVASQKQRQGI